MRREAIESSMGGDRMMAINTIERTHSTKKSLITSLGHPFKPNPLTTLYTHQSSTNPHQIPSSTPSNSLS
jgi:hypothetical protein